MAKLEETTTALAGVQVLDATQMLAGPLAGARLGDLGADVIKIEAPVSGEFNRTHGFDDIRIKGEMSTFLALNRNKRSLAVDLKTDEGRAIFHALCRTADVFLQNFRHGTAERLGAGYEELHALNPRLVYCSISGYGPRAGLTVTDRARTWSCRATAGRCSRSDAGLTRPCPEPSGRLT